MLVVSKKFDPHPAPDVEEDVDGDGDRQQQAVEAHAPAGAAFREVLLHRGGVEQTEERHHRDESHHGGQREHDERPLLTGFMIPRIRLFAWLIRTGFYSCVGAVDVFESFFNNLAS